jgi:hypothetical protein
MVRADILKGKKTGTDIDCVAVRAGSFNVQTLTGVVQGINVRRCIVVHRSDGYSYRGRASSPRINPGLSGAGKFNED